jgi:Arc/MetJ family transcription regulator
VTDPKELPVTDLATSPDTDVEIDSELLDEAQRQLFPSSPHATINEALRRLVEEEREKRRAALEELQQMHDEGHFDYSQLDAAEQ